jgi:hypothetical protein
MNRKQLIVKLALIVSTLGETTEPGQTVPASMIYLALGSNYHEFAVIAGAGEQVGWLKVTSETVALTPAGREKAKAFKALGV